MPVPKKNSVDSGMIPKMRQFLIDLAKRYQSVLRIIDEALQSENFKDKTWAVELILKRLPFGQSGSDADKELKKKGSSVQRLPVASSQDIASMSDEALLQEIQSYLNPSDE